MPTIKCRNCNLVNLSTEPQCKRCKQPFIEETYYPEQNNHFPEAMQLSCIKCGGRNRVSPQNFKKDYIPPISYIGFFFGLLPGVILVRLFKVQHYLTAPFCGDCWSNYNKIGSKETIGIVAFFCAFFIGLFALLATESLLIMFIIFIVGIGLLIHGQTYKSKYEPKYKRVTSREVVITDPVFGDLSFAK